MTRKKKPHPGRWGLRGVPVLLEQGSEMRRLMPCPIHANYESFAARVIGGGGEDTTSISTDVGYHRVD